MTETCTCRWSDAPDYLIWTECQKAMDLDNDDDTDGFTQHVAAAAVRLERERREAEVAAEVPTWEELDAEACEHDDILDSKYIYDRLKPLCRDVEAVKREARNEVWADIARRASTMVPAFEDQSDAAKSNARVFDIAFSAGYAGGKAQGIEIGRAELLAEQAASERVPAICGIVSPSGPGGEPLACGYPDDHDGPHSWSPLPTWTFPPTGLEPRGCPTPGACSCPVAEPLAFPSEEEFRKAAKPDWIVHTAYEVFDWLREYMTPKRPEPVDPFEDWFKEQIGNVEEVGIIVTCKNWARKAWDASGKHGEPSASREQKPS